MPTIIGLPGEKKLLLGNEAIARGVIEAGVGFVAAYPGTPSTEIIEALADAAKEAGIYVEFSTNEIVAYEAAFAASVAGVRSFFAAKHVGINVAADALATSVYIGTNAGFVFVSADDPHAHSSQNEQDNRNLARIYNFVMLEPSSPQEAKDITVKGYEISERVNLPVMIRTTTRISHARGIVTFGPAKEPIRKGKFEKDPRRYVVVPANARRNHAILLKRLEEARKLAEESDLNKVISLEGSSPKIGRFGIISSGVAALYAIEEVKRMGIEADILKLAFTYPLPENKIAKFLENHDVVLVIEEIDPVMERDIRAIAQKNELSTRIHGKDILPSLYELRPEIIEKGLKIVLGQEKGSVPPVSPEPASEVYGVKLPRRPPVLCPGCPHRATYYAVKRALQELGVKLEEVIYPTDIGCMTLGISPPYNMGDILLCMGSSAGTSSGLSKVTDQPVIAFIGDSTFFHAGMPGLANAVFNKHPFILVVLDNEITAMTGFQPDPSTGFTAMGEETKIIDIAEVAKALGADYVIKVDQVLDWNKAKEAFKEAWRKYKEGKVVVAVFRHMCALAERRLRGKAGLGGVYEVLEEKCVNCGICYKHFNCPAIMYDEEKKKPYIRRDLCLGCGVCMQICPVKAIIRHEK
ncbi:MAG: indolepyruvate ferredoxin oxidoreductase subunit alpha [Candidatus Njordarchaeales archaeon]